MGSLGDFWITSSNWSYSASGMLHCSAQSDAPQSTVGALGAVAHTCLFLTCFAHGESTVAILVIFYRVQNIMVFFNTERSWNPTSAMIEQYRHFSFIFSLFFPFFFFKDMSAITCPLSLFPCKIQTCGFFKPENGMYQECWFSNLE